MEKLLKFKEKLKKDREAAFERRQHEKEKRKNERQKERTAKVGKNNSVSRIDKPEDKRTATPVRGKMNRNLNNEEISLEKNEINTVNKPSTSTERKLKKTMENLQKENGKATTIQTRDSLVKHNRKCVRDRVRKCRAKMTPEQLEEKRLKDRERYRLKKEQGLIKNVESLSNRQKTTKRKHWKKASRKYREKKKIQRLTTAYLDENTPSESDSDTNELPDNFEARHAVPQKNVRKNVAHRRVKKARASCYRKLIAIERENKELKKRIEKYRKKIYRRKNTSKSATLKNRTPITRVKEITRGMVVTPTVKRKLIFGEVLQDQIAENIKQTTGNKEKQIAAKLVSGKIIKKYRMIGQAKKIISYKVHKKQLENFKHLLHYDRKRRNYLLRQKIRKSVQEFVENDTNSRMCPGKKDFIRQGKIMKQKRLLLDTYKNTYKKYVEGQGMKISYTTFWRNKPFWVVKPKASDRETCICVKHANIHFIVEKLYFANLIIEKRPQDIFTKVACKQSDIKCMFKLCEKCKKSTFGLNQEKLCHLNDNIKFYQWESATEERSIKGQMKKIKITSKREKHTTVSELLKMLNKQLIEFQAHVFIMKHQMQFLQNKRTTINSNEINIQIDFSENYVCKYATEIQAMHFGASKHQISLHTGVYYVYDPTPDKIQCQCFCSVSDNVEHQSHAIWAHLHKLLSDLSERYPLTKTINFFSDGPTSQYRNKNNCHFLINKVPSYFENIREISWNFSESGHGKGPMDGVGGTLKRKADNLVLQGNDITAAKTFVEKLQIDSTIKIWEVESQEIERVKAELPKNIPSVPSIMSVHQLTWKVENRATLQLRKLSCFSCDYGAQCEHFSLKTPTIQLLTDDHAKISTIQLLKKDSQVRTPTVKKMLKEDSQVKKRTMNKLLKEDIIQTEKIPTVTSPTSQCFNILPEEDNPRAATKLTKPFPDNVQVYGKLCYACACKITDKITGIKCKTCNRGYHCGCILKHKLSSSVDKVFFCKSCASKK